MHRPATAPRVIFGQRVQHPRASLPNQAEPGRRQWLSPGALPMGRSRISRRGERVGLPALLLRDADIAPGALLFGPSVC